jgi:hypothetical protein
MFFRCVSRERHEQREGIVSCQEWIESFACPDFYRIPKRAQAIYAICTNFSFAPLARFPLGPVFRGRKSSLPSAILRSVGRCASHGSHSPDIHFATHCRDTPHASAMRIGAPRFMRGMICSISRDLVRGGMFGKFARSEIIAILGTVLRFELLILQFQIRATFALKFKNWRLNRDLSLAFRAVSFFWFAHIRSC